MNKNKKFKRLRFFINQKFNLYLINADYSSLYNDYDNFYSVFSSLYPLLFNNVDKNYIKEVFFSYFVRKTKTILESLSYYSLLKNFKNIGSLELNDDVFFNFIIDKIKNDEYTDNLFMLSNKQFFILYSIIFSVFYYYLHDDPIFKDFLDNLEIIEIYYNKEKNKINETKKKAHDIIVKLSNFMKIENLNPIFCSSNYYPYSTSYYMPKQAEIYQYSIKESFKHYIYVLYGCANGFYKINQNCDRALIFYYLDKESNNKKEFKNFIQDLSTIALNLKNKKIIKGYFVEDPYSIKSLYFLYYNSKEIKSDFLFDLLFSYNNEKEIQFKPVVKVIYPIKKEKIKFLHDIFF